MAANASWHWNYATVNLCIQTCQCDAVSSCCTMNWWKCVASLDGGVDWATACMLLLSSSSERSRGRNAGTLNIVHSIHTTCRLLRARLQTQQTPVNDTIRYDTRCYFNVRSKAYRSQLNRAMVYRTEPMTKSGKQKKVKSKKRICSEVSVNSPGNPWSRWNPFSYVRVICVYLCVILAVLVSFSQYSVW